MYKLRTAIADDMHQVHLLVCELALYEKASVEVVTTIQELIEDGFGDHPAFECWVVEKNNNEIVGFTLSFTSYSTWKGKSLYLEDFYVKNEYRGQGIGKMLFDNLLELAKMKNVKRFHWQVLEWNQMAIDFYNRYKVEYESDWLNVKIRLE